MSSLGATPQSLSPDGKLSKMDSEDFIDLVAAAVKRSVESCQGTPPLTPCPLGVYARFCSEPCCQRTFSTTAGQGLLRYQHREHIKAIHFEDVHVLHNLCADLQVAALEEWQAKPEAERLYLRFVATSPAITQPSSPASPQAITAPGSPQATSQAPATTSCEAPAPCLSCPWGCGVPQLQAGVDFFAHLVMGHLPDIQTLAALKNCLVLRALRENACPWQNCLHGPCRDGCEGMDWFTHIHETHLTDSLATTMHLFRRLEVEIEKAISKPAPRKSWRTGSCPIMQCPVPSCHTTAAEADKLLQHLILHALYPAAHPEFVSEDLLVRCKQLSAASTAAAEAAQRVLHTRPGLDKTNKVECQILQGKTVTGVRTMRDRHGQGSNLAAFKTGDLITAGHTTMTLSGRDTSATGKGVGGPDTVRATEKRSGGSNSAAGTRQGLFCPFSGCCEKGQSYEALADYEQHLMGVHAAELETVATHVALSAHTDKITGHAVCPLRSTHACDGSQGSHQLYHRNASALIAHVAAQHAPTLAVVAAFARGVGAAVTHCPLCDGPMSGPDAALGHMLQAHHTHLVKVVHCLQLFTASNADNTAGGNSIAKAGKLSAGTESYNDTAKRGGTAACALGCGAPIGTGAGGLAGSVAAMLHAADAHAVRVCELAVNAAGPAVPPSKGLSETTNAHPSMRRPVRPRSPTVTPVISSLFADKLAELVDTPATRRYRAKSPGAGSGSPRSGTAGYSSKKTVDTGTEGRANNGSDTTGARQGTEGTQSPGRGTMTPPSGSDKGVQASLVEPHHVAREYMNRAVNGKADKKPAAPPKEQSRQPEAAAVPAVQPAQTPAQVQPAAPAVVVTQPVGAAQVQPAAPAAVAAQPVGAAQPQPAGQLQPAVPAAGQGAVSNVPAAGAAVSAAAVAVPAGAAAGVLGAQPVTAATAATQQATPALTAGQPVAPAAPVVPPVTAGATPPPAAAANASLAALGQPVTPVTSSTGVTNAPTNVLPDKALGTGAGPAVQGGPVATPAADTVKPASTIAGPQAPAPAAGATVPGATPVTGSAPAVTANIDAGKGAVPATAAPAAPAWATPPAAPATPAWLSSGTADSSPSKGAADWLKPDPAVGTAAATAGAAAAPASAVTGPAKAAAGVAAPATQPAAAGGGASLAGATDAAKPALTGAAPAAPLQPPAATAAAASPAIPGSADVSRPAAGAVNAAAAASGAAAASALDAVKAGPAVAATPAATPAAVSSGTAEPSKAAPTTAAPTQSSIPGTAPQPAQVPALTPPAPTANATTPAVSPPAQPSTVPPVAPTPQLSSTGAGAQDPAKAQPPRDNSSTGGVQAMKDSKPSAPGPIDTAGAASGGAPPPPQSPLTPNAAKPGPAPAGPGSLASSTEAAGTTGAKQGVQLSGGYGDKDSKDNKKPDVASPSAVVKSSADHLPVFADDDVLMGTAQSIKMPTIA